MPDQHVRDNANLNLAGYLQMIQSIRGKQEVNLFIKNDLWNAWKFWLFIKTESSSFLDNSANFENPGSLTKASFIFALCANIAQHQHIFSYNVCLAPPGLFESERGLWSTLEPGALLAALASAAQVFQFRSCDQETKTCAQCKSYTKKLHEK